LERPLYKILTAEQWAAAEGRLPWAPVDVQDGFVHLSAPSQVRETARRHFAGRTGLVLVALDPARFAPGTLRWEPSRGGALFPHVHGDVPLDAVLRVVPLELGDDGFVFPSDVP
jgi:uncharacterized protein (DUF952 family)